MDEILKVRLSDMQKIFDTMLAAKRFLIARDEMNAQVHLAHEVRYSSLTSETMAQCDRMRTILESPAIERGAMVAELMRLEADRKSESKDNPASPVMREKQGS